MYEHFLVKLGADGSQYQASMKRAEEAADKLTGVWGKFKGTVIGGAILAGLTSVWQSLKALSNEADRLGNLAETTGLSAGFLTNLGKQFELNNAKSEDAVKSMETFIKKVGDLTAGEQGAIKTFDRLGISLKDQNGLVKTNAELLSETAEALSKMGTTAERSSIAAELFGNKWGAALNSLSGGAESVRDLQDSSMDFAVAVLSKRGDQWDTIWGELKKSTMRAMAGALDPSGRVADEAFAAARAEQEQGKIVTAQRVAADEAAKAAEEEKKLRLETEAKVSAQKERAADAERDWLMEKATSEEKIVMLRKELDEIIKRNAKTELENLENIEAFQKKRIELERAERKAQDEANRDKLEAEREAARLAKERDQAASDMATRFAERSRFSLADVASLGEDGTRLTPAARAKRDAALRVQRLEFLASEARLQDNPAAADRFTGQALALRKSMSGFLTSAEADPLALAKVQMETRDAIVEVLRKAQAEGLIVQAKMGE